jgi:para-aminobenzoate synthetase component 2
MIDNYDSFVYNLVRYFEELSQNITVRRNDCITIEEIQNFGYRGIIISPGPGTPMDAGVSVRIIQELGGKVPILGVCLGMQSIAWAFGGNVIKGEAPMHGKVSEIFHDGRGVFEGIKSPLQVTRYHSLVVDKETLPKCLKITCQTDNGVIMGLRHSEYQIEGVQFHPEAHLTEHGHDILRNFINSCR